MVGPILPTDRPGAAGRDDANLSCIVRPLRPIKTANQSKRTEDGRADGRIITDAVVVDISKGER